jgi:thiol reductant ABC exporter CydD subunit
MGAVDPRLLRRSRAVRSHLILAVLLGVVSAGAVVVQAWALSQVIARSTAGAGTEAVHGGLFVLAVAVLVRAAAGWIHHVVAARTAASVKNALRDDLMAALLTGGGGRVSSTGSGAAAALVGSGLDALDGWFARYLPQLVLCAVVPAAVAGTVLWADRTAGLTIALTLPLVPFFMVLIGLSTAAVMRRQWQSVERLGRHFADLLGGLPTLVALDRADVQAEGLRRTGERHRAATMRGLRVAFLSALVLELVATLSVAVVAVGVGLRLVHGGMDLQTALFVLLLAPEAYLPLRQLGVHYHDSAAGVAALDKAFALMDDVPTDSSRVRRPTPRAARPVLAVEDVSVTYPGRHAPALEPLTMTVHEGEIVAVSGASGSGKSTLLALLLGLVEPSSGRVRVHGNVMSEVSLPEWHRQVAWVPQVPTIVTGTVSDNVCLGLDGAPAAEVREALAAAGAGHLDLGALLGERGAPAGTSLSAGEQRRVGVARALLRVRLGLADLLLLDEPTAGLDVDREAVVVAALRDSDVTCLVVAHRSRLLAAADRIVALSARSPLEAAS